MPFRLNSTMISLAAVSAVALSLAACGRSETAEAPAVAPGTASSGASSHQQAAT